MAGGAIGAAELAGLTAKGAVGMFPYLGNAISAGMVVRDVSHLMADYSSCMAVPE